MVERNVEIDDDRRGFVVADALNPPKARVLRQLAPTRTREGGAVQEMIFAYRSALPRARAGEQAEDAGF
ncbi:MAG: hypothetical protein RLZZ15_4078, partial [Verrucomicrobiota bacterium]